MRKTLIFISVLLLSNLIIYSQKFSAGLKEPISVYINWSSYDQLSDTVPLTEELAMRELNELIRWKKLGFKADYYLMDMFWFAKDGGYKKWVKEGWSDDGWKKWINKCNENNIKPGLWMSTNVMGWGNMRFLTPIKEWENSMHKSNSAACLFSGGYLPSMLESMQMWYDRGIRMFKFDFAGFWAVTPDGEKCFVESEIQQMNKDALYAALKLFRVKNNDVVLVAYNGYGESNVYNISEYKKTENVRWLEVFDAMYCGDPQPSDIPQQSIYRSMDIFSDYRVLLYEKNGIPLDKIDNTAFFIGNTGTAFWRGKQAWKGMALLSLARGGWFNPYYGNLENLNDDDVKWFAKLQNLYFELQKFGRFTSIGEMPSAMKPYGFKAENAEGALLTIVNPSQVVQKISLNLLQNTKVAIQFSDAGYMPVISNNELTIGPGQLVLIGVNKFASSMYGFGIQGDVVIPKSITKVDAVFKRIAVNNYETTIKENTLKSTLRVIIKQKDKDGNVLKSYGGDLLDNGIKMSEYLKIEVFQNKQLVQSKSTVDKQMWCGISWSLVEIDKSNLDFTKEIKIVFTSKEPKEVLIEGEIYDVNY